MDKVEKKKRPRDFVKILGKAVKIMAITTYIVMLFFLFMIGISFLLGNCKVTCE